MGRGEEDTDDTFDKVRVEGEFGEEGTDAGAGFLGLTAEDEESVANETYLDTVVGVGGEIGRGDLLEEMGGLDEALLRDMKLLLDKVELEDTWFELALLAARLHTIVDDH